MLSVQSQAPQRKRFVSLVDKAGQWYLIEVHSSGTTTFYLATLTRNDLRGASFQLEKQDDKGTADTYHVFTGSIDQHPECGCPDFLFRQRGTCKHIDALRALQMTGKLPGYSSLPVASLVEAGRRFRPGRDDEPRFPRRAGTLRYQQDGTEWPDGPDDAA